MLAGLDAPTAGDILLRGKRINDVPANRRPTCMVFQSLALFPHRTVGENIEFSLKIRDVAAGGEKERALELMRLLRLPESYYGKNVLRCSGGERQRVALARALAYDPEILFFDEPLSAIDYKLRKTLEKELKDIHRETGKTFVYITHSPGGGDGDERPDRRHAQTASSSRSGRRRRFTLLRGRSSCRSSSATSTCCRSRSDAERQAHRRPRSRARSLRRRFRQGFSRVISSSGRSSSGS